MANKQQCAEGLYKLFNIAINAASDDDKAEGLLVESDTGAFKSLCDRLGTNEQKMQDMGLLRLDVEFGDSVFLNVNEIMTVKDAQAQVQPQR